MIIIIHSQLAPISLRGFWRAPDDPVRRLGLRYFRAIGCIPDQSGRPLAKDFSTVISIDAVAGSSSDNPRLGGRPFSNGTASSSMKRCSRRIAACCGTSPHLQQPSSIGWFLVLGRRSGEPQILAKPNIDRIPSEAQEKLDGHLSQSATESFVRCR